MKRLIIYTLAGALMLLPAFSDGGSLAAATSNDRGSDRSSSGRSDQRHKVEQGRRESGRSSSSSRESVSSGRSSSNSRESVSSGRSSSRESVSSGRSSHSSSSHKGSYYENGRSSSNSSRYTTSKKNPSLKVNVNVHKYHSHVRHLPPHAVRHSYHGHSYYCHNGIYYRPWGDRYVICRPPVGAVIAGTVMTAALVAITVQAINAANKPMPITYYYDDGTFYERKGGDYRVIEPPVGAIVEAIPSGYEEFVMDGRTYYNIDGIYYRPVSGGYEVVGKSVK